MAKRAGMDFVTLTDHETIEGALTLTHHPDFFIGEEVSALFPEDGVYADVLIYGLDPADHAEIQSRRGNVYELVDYLREAGLVHLLAHPIYGMPRAVDRTQVEKRLALFGLWEFINGSRPAEQNRLAREIAANAEAADLREVAARHGLPSPPHRSVTGTAGSDDHGGIYGGAAYTIAPNVGSPKEFIEALAAGEVRSSGRDGSVGKLVHTGCKIAAAAIEENREPEPSLLKDLTLNIPVLRNFVPHAPDSTGKLLEGVPTLARLGEDGIRSTLVRRYEKRLSAALGSAVEGSMAGLLGSLGDLIDSHLFIAPHVAVHGYFGRERKKARDLRRELFAVEPVQIKVGAFVDGKGGKHYPANIYRNLVTEAEHAYPNCLQLIGCGVDAGDMHTLRAIAELPSPLEDGSRLGIPSLLEVLEHVKEKDYNILHAATPGPLGIGALVAGLAMGIPVVGAYHASPGEYVRAASGDEFLAGLAASAVGQFYGRCSVVVVPEDVPLPELDGSCRLHPLRALNTGGLSNGATENSVAGADLDELFGLYTRTVGVETETSSARRTYSVN